ncbi:unnamed protein product, partial [Timema podura]|nr:unnamed protein product [Timema podura]
KMCILFLYTKPMVEDGEYRIILASNRDENYTRPAQPLATWIDNPVIMGGRDMEPGKEGGTWLAMGLHGRISILLNILQGKSPLNKGRGNIVSSCLSNKSETTETFLENFRKEIYQYNPFNLITVQIQYVLFPYS